MATSPINPKPTNATKIYNCLKPIVGNRAFPQQAPEDVKTPFIVYTCEVVDKDYTLGSSYAPEKLRITVALYDAGTKSFTDFEALSDLLKQKVEKELFATVENHQRLAAATGETRQDLYTFEAWFV